MTSLLTALWADECGMIISAELVMVGTIGVLAMVSGLVCVRDAVNGELQELSQAIGSIDQSYYYGGMHGCWSRRCGISSFTAGSSYGNLQQVSHVHRGKVIESDLGCRPCEVEEFRSPAAGSIAVPQAIESGSPCPTNVPCPINGPVLNQPCPTPACPPESSQRQLIW